MTTTEFVRWKVTAWDDNDHIYYQGEDEVWAQALFDSKTDLKIGVRLYSCEENREDDTLTEWEIEDWNCDLDTGEVTYD